MFFYAGHALQVAGQNYLVPIDATVSDEDALDFELVRLDSIQAHMEKKAKTICMRIVNSEGEVNIYSLAKNAGTSVDQIERFYAKNLPMAPTLVRNLQSMGKGKL